MQYERNILRALVGLVVLTSCTPFALTSDSALPQPVAVVDDVQLRSDDPLTTLAFLSDTTIEVAACPTVRRDATCSFALFRWENGVLKRSEEPVKVKIGGFVEFVESTRSADGRRIFLDFNDREVPKFQQVIERVIAVATLGMGGPEEVNREVVQVVDTATRKTCFDWRRTFPPTYRMRTAAMSPSGEFVAIKVENKLSIYRLPVVCEGLKASRRKLKDND